MIGILLSPRYNQIIEAAVFFGRQGNDVCQRLYFVQLSQRILIGRFDIMKKFVCREDYPVVQTEAGKLRGYELSLIHI